MAENVDVVVVGMGPGGERVGRRGELAAGCMWWASKRTGMALDPAHYAAVEPQLAAWCAELPEAC